MNGELELSKVHRLKNQLSIILGFTELLIARPDAPPQSDLLAVQKAALTALEILREQS
jgi:hypothetical protein